MRIGSCRDLGLYVRDRRRDLGMSQAALAAAAGVSRRWLTGLEAGKETAEVGLVLKTLYALDLVLDAQPRENLASAGIDLDELLASLDDG
ncbi:MAG TPA: helix-turn-helix domain-containing protein [Micromonosporaceae bacterium]